MPDLLAAKLPRALVVDDDATMRLLLCESLEQAGFHVDEVPDGSSALRSLTAPPPPDIIFLDVDMPKINGFEVCLRLREDPVSAAIPVVMVTGMDDSASIARAYQSGATDFITKPINWTALGYRAQYILRAARTLQALHRSERSYAAIIQAIPDLLLRLNTDMVLLDYMASSNLVPCPLPGELNGHTIAETFPEPTAELLIACARRAFSTRSEQSVEYTSPGSQGVRHYEARFVVVSADEVLALIRDTTDRELAVAKMREALVVFNASLEGIITTDPEGTVLSVNPAFCAISALPPEDLIEKKAPFFSANLQSAEFLHELWQTLTSVGAWSGEVVTRRRSGEIFTLWISIAAVRSPSGQTVEYVALCSDISQRKIQEEAIWRQANFDALTGLANRNLLRDRMNRAMTDARRTTRRIGLLFLDLDGFKWINDALGHDVGDILLVEVARRLETCVRTQDTVARLGGDEFVVVVVDLGEPDDVVTVGNKILKRLSEPYSLAGSTHHLSASIGITIYPDDGDDMRSLSRNADIAMYKAKQEGKNQLQFFAKQMQEDAMARLNLEEELRHAIAKEEFVLYYQPVVDARRGRLVGAEALIRWNHPDRGLVQPNEFIPAAEDSGLIVDIGNWVLREGCRQLDAWHKSGLRDLHLSINVSTVQLRDKALPGLILSLVGQHGIEPGALLLEITESALIDGSGTALARMKEISAGGIGYSLDDFGTGYSSLSYLKKFPFEIVKIDRSFVSDCTQDRNDAKLIEAIINMAHGLDMAVTAEGVETEGQIDLLRDLDCDFLQGYAISRPIPAQDFERLARQGGHLTHHSEATREGERFLTALRNDHLDVDEWLRRLLGEHSPELAEYLAEKGWHLFGLDVGDAVRVHLDWRRRLIKYMSEPSANGTMAAEEASSVASCTLGAWIDLSRDYRCPEFEELDRAHRDFHKQAGRIVADFNLGHHERARRDVAGFRFRSASRQVVITLIECFRNRMESPVR